MALGASFHCYSLLNHPSPVGHQLMERVQNRKTEYDFVEGKNGFNCVSCGTHRRWTSLRHVIRQHENPPEGVRAGSGEPSSLDVAVTTESVRLDKRAAAGSGSSITPAVSVTSRSGSHFCI